MNPSWPHARPTLSPLCCHSAPARSYERTKFCSLAWTLLCAPWQVRPGSLTAWPRLPVLGVGPSASGRAVTAVRDRAGTSETAAWALGPTGGWWLWWGFRDVGRMAAQADWSWPEEGSASAWLCPWSQLWQSPSPKGEHLLCLTRGLPEPWWGAGTQREGRAGKSVTQTVHGGRCGHQMVSAPGGQALPLMALMAFLEIGGLSLVRG